MKLNTLIIGGFLIVALVPLFFVGYLFTDTQTVTQLSLVLNSKNEQIFLIKENIYTFVHSVESDVLFLSELQKLSELVDEENIINKEKLKIDLQKDFLAFSKEKYVYYQVRYIDETGDEIVRIDSNGKEPFIIPEDKLQNKKGRYYFEDAMSARKGKVFVSPLDLNIEQGELENRGTEKNPVYIPVVRYATPVFNNKNESKGIVIINVYADYFLNMINNKGYEGETIILVNKEGYYLAHPNQSKEWGFMFKNNETLQKDYGIELLPETVRHLEEPIQESKLHHILSIQGASIKEYQNYFVVHTHIWPSGNDSLSSTGSNEAYIKSVEKVQGQDYYWTLINIAERDTLLAPVTELKNRALFLGSIIAIIIVTSSFFIARRITKPLEQLSEAAELIGKGNLNKEVKVKSKNEIGNLAETFDNMRINLKNSRAQLVEKEKLEKAYKDLESSNKLKDLFIDIMRHDLLNPAGVVRMNAQVVLMDEKDPKKKERLMLVEKISDRLIKMIENASILSKLESGKKIDFKKEDIGIILQECVETMKSKANEIGKKINVDIKGKSFAMINPLIGDVFSNFISNAVKYGKEKSDINVEIKEKEENWRVSVANSGEKIPDKYKKTIFERFTRLEKGAIKGSGLGLAIVKKIVELHKGKVWVEDNPKGGSVFIVEIPIVGDRK